MVLLTACGRTSPPESVEEAEPIEALPATPDPATPAMPEFVIDLNPGKLVVTLSVDAAEARFMVSEPIYAEIEFRGDPGVEVQMSWMGRNELGRPSNYALAFVGEAGPLAVPDVGMEFGGQSWTAAVGSKPARQRLFLPSWVVELEPGRYTLTAKTTVEARGAESAQWQSVEVSLALPLEVSPDDDARMAALIEALALAAKGDDSDRSREAIEQLAAIDDPRTLPHWLELVVIPDYERRFKAIVRLAKFDDPRALAAVIRASQTKPDELPRDRYTTEALRFESAGQLRVTAAYALDERDEPEALAALLALENDPHDSVRLIVCQRAGRLEGERGLAILERMVKDSSEMVRGEAQRFSSERGTAR